MMSFSCLIFAESEKSWPFIEEIYTCGHEIKGVVTSSPWIRGECLTNDIMVIEPGAFSKTNEVDYYFALDKSGFDIAKTFPDNLLISPCPLINTHAEIKIEGGLSNFNIGWLCNDNQRTLILDQETIFTGNIHSQMDLENHFHDGLYQLFLFLLVTLGRIENKKEFSFLTPAATATDYKKIVSKKLECDGVLMSSISDQYLHFLISLFQAVYNRQSRFVFVQPASNILQNLLYLKGFAFAYESLNVRFTDNETPVDIYSKSRSQSTISRQNTFLASSFYPIELPGYDIFLEFTTKKTDPHFKCLIQIIRGDRNTIELNFYGDHSVKDSAAFFLDSLTNFLKIGLNYPDRQLVNLPILSEGQKDLIINTWSMTKSAQIDYTTITGMFESLFTKFSDKIALESNQACLTYKELDVKSNQLAHMIINTYQPRTEQIIGLILDHSFDYVIACIAILKAGCAFLPIDPTQPIARINYILKDANVKIVFTTSKLLPNVEGNVDFVLMDKMANQLTTQSESKINSTANPNSLAYIIYTSGSTGLPKGVMIQHASICNIIPEQVYHFAMTEKDKILQFASVGFDVCILEWMTALVSGAVLFITDKSNLDNNTFFDVVEQHGLTIAILPPSYLSTLQVKNSSLKTIVVTGEACSDKVMQEWSKHHNFINAYGPTEITIHAIQAPYKPGNKGRTIGKSLANTASYILDEHLNVVPPFVLGQLYIGGIGLAMGYLNKPELTKEKFISSPAYLSHKTSRLYITGDVVFYDTEGDIHYIGREDEQIKLRGFRIELGEIENNCNLFDAINTSAVVCTGAGEHASLTLFYILKESYESLFSEQELKTWLSCKVPYYMLPNRFIKLNALPVSVNGKIDKKELSHMASDLLFTSQNIILPETETQKTLCLIFSDILGVKEIGLSNDFFEYGGNSLTVMQAISRINQTFKIAFPIRQFFNEPFISDIAHYIDNTSSTENSGTIPAISDNSDTQPLSFARVQLKV